MGGRALPRQRVLSLHEQGYSNKRITEIVRAEEHYDYSDGAVAVFLHRNVAERRTYGALPWYLPPQHRHLYPPMMLRFWLRMQDGRKVSDRDRGRTEAYIAKLKKDDLVVHYLPADAEAYQAQTGEAISPFFTLPRRESVDDHMLWANPEVPYEVAST